MASFVTDFIPYVSNVKAAYEASYGIDPFTREKLDTVDRSFAAASIALGPVGKVFKRGKQGLEGLDEAIDAAEEIASAIEKSKVTPPKKDKTPAKGTGKTVTFSEKSLNHANEGDFTRNPKTGEISKMSGGGHGQDNIEFLKQNGMEYSIEKTYPNGVRVGNVPDHKSKGKRTGTGQAWFPENWSKEDIGKAGEYVTNMPEHKNIADGVTVFGDYNGVRVGVIKTNGEIGTIFPDSMLQP